MRRAARSFALTLAKIAVLHWKFLIKFLEVFYYSNKTQVFKVFLMACQVFTRPAGTVRFCKTKRSDVGCNFESLEVFPFNSYSSRHKVSRIGKLLVSSSKP